MIKIKRTDNGAVMEWTAGTTDEHAGSQCYVFDDEDKDGLLEMLYDIKTIFVSEGKYSPERIEIKKVHGENYECEDETCEICKENK